MSVYIPNIVAVLSLQFVPVLNIESINICHTSPYNDQNIYREVTKVAKIIEVKYDM